MDYSEWVSKRISQLRVQKGVSARDMSLPLGQSESYINKIVNRRTMPSLTGFFYICEYLGMTPKEFFDPLNEDPAARKDLLQCFDSLTPKQREHILCVIKDLAEK